MGVTGQAHVRWTGQIILILLTYPLDNKQISTYGTYNLILKVLCPTWQHYMLFYSQHIFIVQDIVVDMQQIRSLTMILISKHNITAYLSIAFHFTSKKPLCHNRIQPMTCPLYSILSPIKATIHCNNKTNIFFLLQLVMLMLIN